MHRKYIAIIKGLLEIPDRAILFVMAKFTSLSEAHVAQGALERFLPRVGVLVLLLVLAQTEGLWAIAALQFLLRVVLLVVSLEGELRLKGCFTAEDVTFKDGKTFTLLFLCSLQHNCPVFEPFVLLLRQLRGAMEKLRNCALLLATKVLYIKSMDVSVLLHGAV